MPFGMGMIIVQELPSSLSTRTSNTPPFDAMPIVTDVSAYLLASRLMMAWRGDQGGFAPTAWPAAFLESIAQAVRAAAAAAMRLVMASPFHIGVWISPLMQPHPPKPTLRLCLSYRTAHRRV